MAGDLVLLTGGTGMIGFKVLVLLVEAGYNVRAAVRSQAGYDKIAALPPVSKYQSQLSSVIVPDITIPGAYDEAVKDVKYIVHVASPLAGNVKGTDYEESIIKPAIQGTVGILESAAKTTGISRVVITASVVSIANPEKLTPDIKVDEQYRNTQTEGPFGHQFAAYSASKALAYEASRKFMKENNPSFDVINIMPVFVIGRDDTVTDANGVVKGTNGFIMGPVLGHPLDPPVGGMTVHLDDVAKMHVLSLDPKIEGNQDFLASGPNNGSVEWADSFDIVKKHFPKQYDAGAFNFDSDPKLATPAVKISSAKASKTFGFTFKNFEEQVTSVVSHFLELTGQA